MMEEFIDSFFDMDIKINMLKNVDDLWLQRHYSKINDDKELWVFL